jgi:hypothetical protein
MEKFNWVVVDKNNKTIAGASDQGKAEVIAKALGGTAKENALVEMTGELSVNKAGFWFGLGERNEDLVIALRRVLDLPLSYPARGSNEVTEIGYVTITIEAATKPDEVTATDYREV